MINNYTDITGLRAEAEPEPEEAPTCHFCGAEVAEPGYCSIGCSRAGAAGEGV